MKPQKNYKRFQIGYSLLFLLFPFIAMAQDVFVDNVTDQTPVTPIDNHLLLLMSISIYFTFRFFKTNDSIKTKN